MVPEISSATDIIFCHFGQYFNHLPPKHPKNQNFEKMKKSCGHIIILHKCIKNQDHMVYCSWDMACDKCNCYFSFCTIFCPFTPNLPEKWKLKKKKNEKNTWIYHHHMQYCSWDMAHDRCNYYCSFWANFCPFTPLTAQKIKISKKWKKQLEISSFYSCVTKAMIRWCMVPEKWCAMDGWTEKVTHRGGCPT